MKRLVRKSQKEYKTKEEVEHPEVSEKQEELPKEEPQQQEGVEPFTDIEREDPYLGRYVEITNKRSKYFGYHAKVEDEFYSDRYKILLEPKRYDDDGGKGYIINFVGVDVAPKWFTVIE